MSELTINKGFTPDYPYCIICGTESLAETCKKKCKDKLEYLRSVIKLRKDIEAMGVKEYDEKTIRVFNRLQNSLG